MEPRRGFREAVVIFAPGTLVRVVTCGSPLDTDVSDISLTQYPGPTHHTDNLLCGTLKSGDIGIVVATHEEKSAFFRSAEVCVLTSAGKVGWQLLTNLITVT